ncbi:MAG: glycerate dehydrogenase [Gammaproteobacteria bacterium]|nr:glycerate dehydrogenase [Gammaproteobacteria bacterium]
MRAVFLDYETVSKGDLDISGLTGVMPGLQIHGSTSDSEIAGRIADAEIVLLNNFVLTRALMHGAERLKLIALAATGTDNVDLTAARERAVGVCNVSGYCSRSVMQQVWAMILGLTQRLDHYTRLAKNGSWERSEAFDYFTHPIRELTGRTFGVVGWGELGRAAAGAAEAFGMRVVIANRPGGAHEPGRFDLDQVLAMSDVVSLHCPLNEATRGLIGTRELALMKPDALLINTARGGLIDSHALAAALKAHRLGGAGIDVLPQEPPVDGDPLLDPDVPNLLLTPHVAWAAREARQRCLDEIAANVRDFLMGGRRGRVV